MYFFVLSEHPPRPSEMSDINSAFYRHLTITVPVVSSAIVLIVVTFAVCFITRRRTTERTQRAQEGKKFIYWHFFLHCKNRRMSPYRAPIFLLLYAYVWSPFFKKWINTYNFRLNCRAGNKCRTIPRDLLPIPRFSWAPFTFWMYLLYIK